MNNKVILIIMDGWGLTTTPESCAVTQANTPFVDGLYNRYPHTELITHGNAVGLPEGQMGNSEVGHLNIGAGRIVDQELMRIRNLIVSGDLASNPVLEEAISKAKNGSGRFHLMGLVSDGGVHSHVEHLEFLAERIASEGLQVFIHSFTDGRDTDPHQSAKMLAHLEAKYSDRSEIELTSVIGRYYAMDRDKRWERISKAYDLLVHGKGEPTNRLSEAIGEAYNDGQTDEFLEPIFLSGSNGTINPNDTVLCFNFRTDRCRQITDVLTQNDHPDHNMTTLDLNYYTMTEYDHSFKNVGVLLKKEDLKATLGEIVAAKGLKQVRIAETEKYPHVTYFFNGGREEPFVGEERILVNSPKVATYDLQPEMSAPEVTDQLEKCIEESEPDLIILNYANTDMVGHTGVFEAAVKAAETVDSMVKRITELCLSKGYTIFITSDHGNADRMKNSDGSVYTAHTMNPVPFIVVSNRGDQELRKGILGDVAPTILAEMGLEQPKEMTGKSLYEVS